MALGTRTNFEYHAPETLAGALDLLAEYREDARPIAGGTDLIPKIKSGILEFSHLVSLKNIDELKKIYISENGELHVGCCVTLRETENFPGVKETWPALATAIHSMANTQVKNRGTLSGNICNAVPSCENGPNLLVYDASVVIKSIRGERVVPVETFFVGILKTCLEPDELLTEIIIPRPAEGSFSVYYKYALRKALDLAMVGVAANVLLEKGVVKDAKIALGAVAVVPKRARSAEKSLIGKELTEDVILEAARIASEEDCRPITDIRATAEYRREMVRIYVRNALRAAAGKEGECK